MASRHDKIHSYSLFGESAHLPDVMHCETIAARSALHDWELEPHRHARLHQVLVLESGGGVVHVEGDSFALRPRTLLNIPAGFVHGFSFDRGSDGFVTTLPDELLDELLAGAGPARRTLSDFALAPVDRRLRPLLRQIWTEFNGRDPARALVLRGLCGALLGLVARAIADDARPADDPAMPALLKRFEALLEAHYAEQWRVARYADALGVSPTHLSRVVRALTGAPASAVIDGRVMREARRLLVYTTMNVTTVAYSLGYTDPAHFSRAFSRSIGLSPRSFRERIARA